MDTPTSDNRTSPPPPHQPSSPQPPPGTPGHQSAQPSATESTSPTHAFSDEEEPPRRNPIPLNTLMGIEDIQSSIIRQGMLDRGDILQLESSGVRMGVTDDRFRTLRGGQETQCDVWVNFNLKPRQEVNHGVGRCLNTNINCSRVRPCEGAREHRGPEARWDAASIYSMTQMEGLIPLIGPINHRVPDCDQSDGPFMVCIECWHDAMYSYRIPPVANDIQRTHITRNWVPYCEMHSLEFSSQMAAGWPGERVPPGACRCVEQINRGWSCHQHRNYTHFNLERRARHHHYYLRERHFRKIRARTRSRFAPAKKPKNTNPSDARKRLEQQSVYHEVATPEKPMRMLPGCPQLCPRPSWKTNGEPRERIAKCLGCGGLVRCKGPLNDLSPQ